MGAGGEVRARLINQAQIRLVDQRGGSQRLLPMPAQALAMRDDSEVSVDQLEQLIPGVGAIACGYALEQSGNVSAIVHRTVPYLSLKGRRAPGQWRSPARRTGSIRRVPAIREESHEATHPGIDACSGRLKRSLAFYRDGLGLETKGITGQQFE